jgi:hypothetical protein
VRKSEVIAGLVMALGIVAAIMLLTVIATTWSYFRRPAVAQTVPGSEDASDEDEPAAPVNLLVNPGFEGEYYVQDGVSEVNVPIGWRAWYVDVPWCRPLKDGCDLPCPSNCRQAGVTVAMSSTVVELGGDLVPGEATTLTLSVLSGVGVVEGRLFYNPVIFDLHARNVGCVELHEQPGVLRFDCEMDGSGGIGAYVVVVPITDVVTSTLELVYWAGSVQGGWFGGRPEASRPEYIAQVVTTGAKCSTDYGCYWARPEFVPTDRPERVRSGERAQKHFTYGRMHRAGLMQQVAVTPGMWLRFSAWMQAWQCYDWNECCHHRPSCISDDPASMGLRVGIDPAGGVDPAAATVVWSAPGEAFDAWREFSVATAAQAPTVTVFVRSDARFDYARVNNDVYVDDASLVQAWPVFLPAVMRGD